MNPQEIHVCITPSNKHDLMVQSYASVISFCIHRVRAHELICAHDEEVLWGNVPERPRGPSGGLAKSPYFTIREN